MQDTAPESGAGGVDRPRRELAPWLRKHPELYEGERIEPASEMSWTALVPSTDWVSREPARVSTKIRGAEVDW